MMVEIGRFAVRWTLADDSARPVAAASLDRLLDGALEAALGELVGPDELVAVASIAVGPVALRRPEDAIGWAALVASAVVSRLAAGGPEVVRYRSARAARTDLVTRAALGDTRREWAWLRLGLWPDGPVPDAVAEVLAADPAGIAPVFAAVARAAVLPAVVGLLGPQRLLWLATLAWSALGAPEPSLSTVDVRPAPGSVRSPLARALVEGSPTAVVPAATRVALAALAVADAEPAAVAAGTGPGLVAALLAGGPRGSDAPLAATGSEIRSVDGPITSAEAAAGTTVRVVDLDLSNPVQRRAADTAGDVVPAGQTPRGGGNAGGDTDREGCVSQPATVDGLMAAGTSGAPTRHAGLLYCLHLLRPLLVPARPLTITAGGRPTAPIPAQAFATIELADGAAERIAELDLRAVLHRLGLALAASATRGPGVRPLSPDDPAVLAFCGLPPDAAAPDPPTDPAATDTAIAPLAAATVAALRHRLAGRTPAAGQDAEMLATVLYRRGEIVADPGWLAVRLDPDEVSVDIRAAGLDLDPGWLPGLGCVVRFHYG